MKTKKMIKAINEAIEASTEENPVTRESVLVTLLTAGAKASSAMLNITKVFKEAGIITVSSTSALAECREYLASSMPEMSTYGDMVQHAQDMQDKFEINADEDKGVASAIKLIKEQLKEDELSVPRKVQLGDIASLKCAYFKDEENEPESVKGLTQYILDNIDADQSILDDEKFKKKIAISAGTDFTYSLMIKNGQDMEDMN